MEKQQTKKTFYFIIYLIGIVAGLALTLIATWGDLEAAFYGFDRTGGLRLSSLSCPILMSNTETSNFSIKIKNSTDKKVSPSVKTDISSPIAPISSYENILLEPGETKKLEYALTPENIDLNRFIFARAWVYASYPLPDREATCGVLILPIPVRGSVITWGLVLLSILGMGVGLYMQNQVDGQERGDWKFSRSGLIAIIVVFGLLVSYLGVWLFGVLTLVLALLLSVISIGHSIKI